MRKILWVCLAVLMVAVPLACSGKKGVSIKFYPGIGDVTGRKLVVLLPTIGGKGEAYQEEGFIQAFRSRGGGADIIALDVAPSLYLGKRIVEVLKSEVITPAKQKGYEAIYLVGTSLGGHGALLYATEYPKDVNAVVLFAPFVTGYPPTDLVEEPGGLKQWDEKCPFTEWTYACNMWRAVKKYGSDPDHRQDIYLAYGTEDGFAKECGILAEFLPPENVYTTSGGHDWLTWEKLWLTMFDDLKVRQRKLRKY
jgi:pimeloyl-ACP methyl ester carboxylesterase